MSRSQKNARRNYKREYETFHKKPSQLKRNNARHRARYAAEKAGKVHVGDKKDVHHKDGNPQNNSPSNLQVMPEGKNRSRK